MSQAKQRPAAAMALRQAVLANWAEALSTPALTDNLRRLADDIRSMDPLQRSAILLEAARRLDVELP